MWGHDCYRSKRLATQSFIHALMYAIRDGRHIGSTLSVANCSNSTRGYYVC